MFQRAGTKVTEFYKQTDKPAPDFSIQFDSIEANVEAKLLVKSDLEEMFEQYGGRILEEIFKQAMPQESIHPPVSVVFKDVGNLPDSEKAVNSVIALLSDSQPPPKESRTECFNIFVGPAPPGKGLYRGCYLLCPRSEKENLRVANRVSKASQQLLSASANERPGFLWLGMTRHQNANFLRDQFAAQV